MRRLVWVVGECGVDGFGVEDTAHYWDLTEHIFRYNHHYTGSVSWLAEGAHTINECKAISLVV